MKVLRSTSVLLFSVFALNLSASDKGSLQRFMEPIYEYTSDAPKEEGVNTLACFGGFGPDGKPYTGAVNPEHRACVYKYKLSASELSDRYIWDGAHSEFLDISYQDLLTWLKKHASKLPDSTDEEQYFKFSYAQITGSTSTSYQRDTFFCAQWLSKKQELSFGFLMDKSDKQTCLLSGHSRYFAKVDTDSLNAWETHFYELQEKAWCSDTHSFNFCTPTQEKGAKTIGECAHAAIAKSDAAGFCWDGAHCCHVTDKLNENDRGGGDNRCYLKTDKSQDDYLTRCKKIK